MESPFENEVLTISDDFISQLNDVTLDMTEPSTTEQLQQYLAKFIKNSAQFMESSGMNAFLKRFALSLQFGAVTVDAIDTFLPEKWLEAHSCYQPDGSHDFSKDIPKLIFLSTIITYGILDYALTKKLGVQTMAKVRQFELPAITSAGVCIFLENLKPNLGFDSTWTIRELQGLIIADFIRETALTLIEPKPELLNQPIIAAPLGTLKLTAKSIRIGTLSYTTAFVFANIFVLALMANDPKNFHTILNGILLGGVALGAASNFNDKLNSFVEAYVTPITSNMNLSVLALMSLIDCWFPLSSVDNPGKWLAIALCVYATVGSLTAVLTHSNLDTVRYSPTFFANDSREQKAMAEDTYLNIPGAHTP
jgi:hypothetical protein